MLAEVFFLLGSLSPSRVAPKSAAPCAIAITRAAVDADATMPDALIAAVFAAEESACTPRALSPDGQDCGLMQLRGWAQRGHSCSDLREDPVLSVRTWLADLAELRGACGSTRAALGALATGKCNGAPKLVGRRMKIAGLE